MRRTRAYWLLAAGIALGCGGTPTNNNGNNNDGVPQYPGDPGGSPVQAATVDILDNSYSPSAVVVAVGGTVTFHWVGGGGHSVTPSGAPTFSPTAGISYPPKDLTVTFTAAGTYEYYCIIHGSSDGYGSRGNMLGTVIVR
jgi:plastocyanin